MKFIVFGQSRSGSTLLVELLNNHPQIHCDGELLVSPSGHGESGLFLKFTKNFPLPYLSYRRLRAGRDAYGFKLLFYQLRRARLNLPLLRWTGWQFIHVRRRNIVNQTISSIIANRTQRWHRRDGTDSSDVAPITITVDEIDAEMARRSRWAARENELAARFDHLDVCYEDDLQRQDSWQATMDRITGYLGLAKTEPGRVGLRKIVDRHYGEIISNYDELRVHLIDRGYGSLLN